MYVQPIYITAERDETETAVQSPLGLQPTSTGLTGIPEFKRVVVSYNGDIQMRDSLSEALAAVFGGVLDPPYLLAGIGVELAEGVPVPQR